MMRVMLTLFLSEMVGGCSNFMLSNEYQLSVSTAITPSSLLQCSAQVLFLHQSSYRTQPGGPRGAGRAAGTCGGGVAGPDYGEVAKH